MLKNISRTVLLFLMMVMISCSTTKSSEEKNKAEQRIQTAKINAELGLAYLNINNVYRAKEKLLLALKQAPSAPEPWYSMGYFMETTGNKNMAEKFYLEAVNIAPNRGDVQNNYGTFLCRSHQYALSIKHFLMAIKDPNYLDSSSAYENAGKCAMKMHDVASAKKYFARAMKEDPTRLLAMNELISAK